MALLANGFVIGFCIYCLVFLELDKYSNLAKYVIPVLFVVIVVSAGMFALQAFAAFSQIKWLLLTSAVLFGVLFTLYLVMSVCFVGHEEYIFQAITRIWSKNYDGVFQDLEKMHSCCGFHDGDNMRCAPSYTEGVASCHQIFEDWFQSGKYLGFGFYATTVLLLLAFMMSIHEAFMARSGARIEALDPKYNKKKKKGKGEFSDSSTGSLVGPLEELSDQDSDSALLKPSTLSKRQSPITSARGLQIALLSVSSDSDSDSLENLDPPNAANKRDTNKLSDVPAIVGPGSRLASGKQSPTATSPHISSSASGKHSPTSTSGKHSPTSTSGTHSPTSTSSGKRSPTGSAGSRSSNRSDGKLGGSSSSSKSDLKLGGSGTSSKSDLKINGSATTSDLIDLNPSKPDSPQSPPNTRKRRQRSNTQDFSTNDPDEVPESLLTLEPARKKRAGTRSQALIELESELAADSPLDPAPKRKKTTSATTAADIKGKLADAIAKPDAAATTQGKGSATGSPVTSTTTSPAGSSLLLPTVGDSSDAEETTVGGKRRIKPKRSSPMIDTLSKGGAAPYTGESLLAGSFDSPVFDSEDDKSSSPPEKSSIKSKRSRSKLDNLGTTDDTSSLLVPAESTKLSDTGKKGISPKTSNTKLDTVPAKPEAGKPTSALVPPASSSSKGASDNVPPLDASQSADTTKKISPKRSKSKLDAAPATPAVSGDKGSLLDPSASDASDAGKKSTVSPKRSKSKLDTVATALSDAGDAAPAAPSSDAGKKSTTSKSKIEPIPIVDGKADAPPSGADPTKAGADKKTVSPKRSKSKLDTVANAPSESGDSLLDPFASADGKSDTGKPIKGKKSKSRLDLLSTGPSDSGAGASSSPLDPTPGAVTLSDADSKTGSDKKTISPKRSKSKLESIPDAIDLSSTNKAGSLLTPADPKADSDAGKKTVSPKKPASKLDTADKPGSKTGPGAFGVTDPKDSAPAAPVTVTSTAGAKGAADSKGKDTAAPTEIKKTPSTFTVQDMLDPEDSPLAKPAEPTTTKIVTTTKADPKKSDKGKDKKDADAAKGKDSTAPTEIKKTPSTFTVQDMLDPEDSPLAKPAEPTTTKIVTTTKADPKKSTTAKPATTDKPPAKTETVPPQIKKTPSTFTVEDMLDDAGDSPLADIPAVTTVVTSVKTSPKKEDAPEAKPATDAKKSTTPAKKADTAAAKPAADAKKADTAAAKPTADAKKADTPAAKPATDAKKAETDAKKASTPAKKADTPAAKPATDAKKTDPPAKKADTPAAKPADDPKKVQTPAPAPASLKPKKTVGILDSLTKSQAGAAPEAPAPEPAADPDKSPSAKKSGRILKGKKSQLVQNAADKPDAIKTSYDPSAVKLPTVEDEQIATSQKLPKSSPSSTFILDDVDGEEAPFDPNIPAKRTTKKGAKGKKGKVRPPAVSDFDDSPLYNTGGDEPPQDSYGYDDDPLYTDDAGNYLPRRRARVELTASTGPNTHAIKHIERSKQPNRGKGHGRRVRVDRNFF